MTAAPAFADPRRRFMFGGLLMWVMTAATASTVTLPVIASFLIDESLPPVEPPGWCGSAS